MVAGEERDRGDGHSTFELLNLAMRRGAAVEFFEFIPRPLTIFPPDLYFPDRLRDELDTVMVPFDSNTTDTFCYFGRA